MWEVPKNTKISFLIVTLVTAGVLIMSIFMLVAATKPTTPTMNIGTDYVLKGLIYLGETLEEMQDSTTITIESPALDSILVYIQAASEAITTLETPITTMTEASESLLTKMDSIEVSINAIVGDSVNTW